MPDNLHFIAYAEDPLQQLARQLLADQQSRLPRLETVTILLPDPQAAVRLRRELLRQAETLGYSALLGPRILGLSQWLGGFGQGLPAPVSAQRRELILLNALRQHPGLFGEGNEWALTDSLLELFDELGEQQVRLPEDAATFIVQLTEGYRLPGEKPHQALQREAQLVHTLWQAWHSELGARALLDRPTHRLLQRQASLAQPPEGALYLLAPACLSRSEREWLAGLVRQPTVTVMIQAQLGDIDPGQRGFHPERPLQQLAAALDCNIPTPPVQPRSQVFDTLYLPDAEQGEPLAARARALAERYPDNPLHAQLSLFAAHGNEEEAQAVALQVRRWLLEGRERIGIVTENRKLARRVRALLERAGIPLEDAGGWALSTTSAAAVLERWLQCVEEDFPHVALLDLLKSPFIVADEAREAHLQTVYRLQHDLIEGEGIGSGLSRYRHHLRLRQRRLPGELGEQLSLVDTLLERLAKAAATLGKYVAAGEQSALGLFDALLRSLESLGISPQLAEDAAGQRLLDELQQMRAALVAEPLRMDWLAFRGWLGRSLERYHFQPPASGFGVELMGLSQSEFAHFDGLIIAALEREFLPGGHAGTPFFNDAVRRELGLPCGDERLSERFYHYRRLLEAAPQIMLSYRQHEGDEEITPSPWLEGLRALLQLAWGEDAQDRELAALLQDPATRITATTPLPAVTSRPAPSLPGELLRHQYSASAYQQLLDCPYQFFAARGLRLVAPEPIREALEKSDYGERVHRCLQAFHGGIAGLPGPFDQPFQAQYRDPAIKLLTQISEAVFAADLEDNFLHRGWLQRWLKQIPAYIDWQLERARHWQVSEVEQNISHPVDGVVIHGRLDRIDADSEQLGIIDYKTGTPPKQEEVLAGEQVQLPFYALLRRGEARPVGEVAYLKLDDKGVKQPYTLAGEELDGLSEAVLARLKQLDLAIEAGEPLPAWGDEKVCEYCRMAGLCRRQMWPGEEEAPSQQG